MTQSKCKYQLKQEREETEIEKGAKKKQNGGRFLIN